MAAAKGAAEGLYMTASQGEYDDKRRVRPPRLAGIASTTSCWDRAFTSWIPIGVSSSWNNSTRSGGPCRTGTTITDARSNVFRLAVQLDPEHAYAHHYLAYNLDWLAEETRRSRVPLP